MKLAALTKDIRDIERRIAYGSETVLWGRYLDRMREVTGVWSPDPEGCGDVDIDDAEADWWLAAYALYEERGDEYDDIQTLLDAVVVD